MMNAWTSSPSLPLEAPSSEQSSSALFVGWHIILTLPHRLWDAYVANLWHYRPDSWVSRVASTFRILAIVLVLPVVLLTLLDVTSYVIARTLGVVDDVKAATSDADSTADGRPTGGTVAVPVSVRMPSAFLSEGPARGSEGLAPEDSGEGQTAGDGCGRGKGRGYEDGDGRASETAVRTVSATMHARMQAHWQARGHGQMEVLTETEMEARASGPQAYHFTGEEHLRLAGEGVFSPAVSMPPSPLTPRMQLHAFTESDGRGSGQVSDEEGIVLRRRVQGAQKDELVQT